MTAEVTPYPDDAEMAFTIDHSNEEDDFVERGTNIPFNADPVRSYLRSIGRTPLLNAEQEVELAKRIEAGVYAGRLLTEYEAGELDNDDRGDEAFWNDLAALAEDGMAAKAHLMEANLRLVVNLAKRYTHRGLPFLDLIQEGNLGLNRAVEKFDYARGYKFSTYSTWWIRQAITRALADTAKTIRIPVHMEEELSKLRRLTNKTQQDLGREATTDELAEELGITKQKVEQLRGYARLEPMSLNIPIGEVGGRGQTDAEFGDLIADNSTATAHEEYEKQELAETLDYLLNTLDVREAGVIRMRFGLDGEEPRTLEDIGKIYGVTRERIRQLEKKGMSLLKSGSRRDLLQTFLDKS